MIYILLVLMFAAVILTAGSIWVLFGYAERLGLVDHADIDRKKHVGQTPLIGGISIFMCLQIFQFISPSYPIALSAALGTLVFVGVIDDRSNLRAATKLLFQFLAAAVMIFGANIEIVSLGTLPNGAEFLTGYFSIPFTLICSVCLINAINMIDGVDGLAASLTILALIYLISVSVLVGRPIDTSSLLAAAILVGTLLGFLIFNFECIPGKKIFLGDAGSMMLGLFLAYVLIQTSQRPPLISALPASIVPWVIAVPVLDIITVTVLRVMQGKPPMQADRAHLHHRLMDFGYSPRQTLLLMLFLSLILFLFGILLLQMGGLQAGFGFLFILPIYAVLKGQIGQNQFKS